MNLLDLISGAGNLLDLPGSSVRDLLSGRNPFDQWTTPFSSDNRASGRDMLAPILGSNKETGMSGWLSDPMEGLKDIAGFGAEVITDPMNLIPAGWFGKVLGSRKATQAANAATKAERAGKYSFVNPKLLARTADEAAPIVGAVSRQNPMAVSNAVDPALAAATGQNPMKLLGYSPPPETVYHGGWDWSASATPEHPYGTFDLGKIHTGEGNTVRGPGAYFADNVKTTSRYKAMAQGSMDEAFYSSPEAMEKYFTVGEVLPSQYVNGAPMDVVNFERSGDRWAVGLRDRVWSDKAGDFVSDPRDHVRWHATRPDMKLLRDKLGDNPMQARTYTLDMPPGSKEKFMGWEDPLSSQPPAVQSVAGAHPAIKAIEDFDKVDQELSDLRYELGKVKNKYGFNAMDMKATNPEIESVRSRIAETKARADQLKATLDEVVPPYTQSALNASGYRGQNLFEMLTRLSAADAGFGDVAALRESGIPGMKSLANSTGRESHNYAVWDPELIKQMRVRAIDGQRVPINPTTLIHQIEQGVPRAAVADSPLLSNMNPMNLQRPQTVANPVALALLQNLLSRNNNWAGGYQ